MKILGMSLTAFTYMSIPIELDKKNIVSNTFCNIAKMHLCNTQDCRRFFTDGRVAVFVWLILQSKY